MISPLDINNNRLLWTLGSKHKNTFKNFCTTTKTTYLNVVIISWVEQERKFIFSNRSYPNRATKELHLSCPVQTGRFNRFSSYSKAISYCNSLWSAPLVHSRPHSICYSNHHSWSWKEMGHTETYGERYLQASWVLDCLSFIHIYSLNINVFVSMCILNPRSYRRQFDPFPLEEQLLIHIWAPVSTQGEECHLLRFPCEFALHLPGLLSRSSREVPNQTRATLLFLRKKHFY